MVDKIKLSPPWLEFYREIELLFGQDPEIKVEYVEEPCAVKLYVDNSEKAKALNYILPTEKDFGGKVIHIIVVPPNIIEPPDKAKMFKTAFEGNPIFSRMVEVDGVFINPIHYLCFKKEVVQYWNDDLSNPHGITSTLYQHIAQNVFDTPEIIFTTESE